MPSTLPVIQGRLRNSLAGVDLAVREYPEAASQSFKMGDPVYLSSGKLTRCAANGNPVANVSSVQILGIAQADATGTTDTMLPVAIADDNLEWLLPVGDDDGTSEVTAVTQVGTNYELFVDSNGTWILDVTETTDVHAVVQEIAPTAIDGTVTPVGTAWGAVWVKIIPASRQLN